jgi:hypothetical protein
MAIQQTMTIDEFHAQQEKARYAKMLEATFVDWVIDYAKGCGWLVSHQRPAKTKDGYRTAIQGHKGFMDLVLMHGQWGRTVFAEAKREIGVLSPEQADWLDAATRTLNSEVFLWKPHHESIVKRVLGRPERWAGTESRWVYGSYVPPRKRLPASTAKPKPHAGKLPPGVLVPGPNGWAPAGQR